MNNRKIENNLEIESGKYYHCFNKLSGIHSINECHVDVGEVKYLGHNKIWATDDNNQALDRWFIFGPIEIPMIGGIELCIELIKTHDKANEFNPDWSLLHATQESLQEHMALLNKYKIALHDAVNRPKGVIPDSAAGLYN